MDSDFEGGKKKVGRPAGRGVVVKLTIPAPVFARLEAEAAGEFATVKDIVLRKLGADDGNEG